MPHLMDSPPRAARGFGLLQAMLVLVLVGAAVSVGAVLLRASAPTDAAQAQERALASADTAIAAYAAAYARLPCPAASADGVEDCTLAKGWLPRGTLEASVGTRLDHDGSGIAGGPMRYLVHRATASDLAVAASHYEPPTWDADNSDADGYTFGSDDYGFGAVNGLDFCAALATAAAAAPSTASAWVPDADGATRNVAYALAAPGPTPGAGGSLFDGENATAAARMESPFRTTSAAYDDRVRTMGFDALAQRMQCDVAMASIGALARGVNIVDEASGLQENNYEDGVLGASVGAVQLILLGTGIATTTADIVVAGTNTGVISAQLSAAIAACALPPWVQCALIPVYAGALTLEGTAVALQGVALAATAGAMVGQIAAIAMFAAVAIEAGVDADELVSEIDLSTHGEAICTAATQLDANADGYEADAAAARSKADQKRAVLEADVAALVGGGTDDSDAVKAERITALTTALDQWAAAKQDAMDASGALRNAQDQLTALNVDESHPPTGEWLEEKLKLCAAQGIPADACELPAGVDGAAAQRCVAATAAWRADPSIENELKMEIACDTVTEIETMAAEAREAIATATAAREDALEDIAGAEQAHARAAAVLPRVEEVCTPTLLNTLDCPSIDVTGIGLSGSENQWFVTSDYCSERYDGEGKLLDGLACDVNALRVRATYRDVMGYAPETPASPSDDPEKNFDPATMLGADGTVALERDAQALEAAAASAREQATEAAENCAQFSTGGSIPLEGTAIELWSGAEGVLRRADHKGAVGPAPHETTED
ncbi:hypothetical protein [Coralloluteibacterium stylophorae]|uniref:Uncharacterized protein n=1 Tax=Coralloluteibacterium stylophorae TaxID=1776034 RepID=A0A8J7VW86_9GAMM|nr:hypothetical protein [Coralloluteibacterium stylophorae]MBS7456801.1 hypothetical protein [Coralloluteibacterium stylophorae]